MTDKRGFMLIWLAVMTAFTALICLEIFAPYVFLWTVVGVSVVIIVTILTALIREVWATVREDG